MPSIVPYSGSPSSASPGVRGALQPAKRRPQRKSGFSTSLPSLVSAGSVRVSLLVAFYVWMVRRQRGAMGGTVDAARQATDDDHPGFGQPGRQVGRERQPAGRGRTGADQGHHARPAQHLDGAAQPPQVKTVGGYKHRYRLVHLRRA